MSYEKFKHIQQTSRQHLALCQAMITASTLRNLTKAAGEDIAIASVGGEPNYHLLKHILARFEVLMNGGQLAFSDALNQLLREGYAERLNRMEPGAQEQVTH